MQLQDFYKASLAALSKGGGDVPDVALRQVLKMRAGIDWSDLITMPERELDQDVLALLESDVTRHNSGEPLSKIYGKAEFFGLEFEVNEHVLDPRPDTETLIERALAVYSGHAPGRIVDLGTGTGCIAITLLKKFPEAQGLAVDLSGDALKVARRNAESHGVLNRMSFIQSSWLDDVELQNVDFITANPPYIRSDVIPTLDESVLNHDPILALDGGADGLEPYKAIFSSIYTQKNKGNFEALRGLFEIGFDQGDDVVRLAEDSRFTVHDVIVDSAGKPRVVDISF
jgi:release factor glutamine methyltransferase